jgi:hypothetical protein
MKKNTEKDRIRAKIVLPLIILLTISGILSVYGVYVIENRHFADEINFRTVEVDKLFDGLLYKESKFMRAQLQFIEDDPGLLEAWRSRDRQVLYNRARPIFEEISAGFNVTHFYFIEPDGVAFLRVHAPGKYGDLINRFTLKKAVADSKTTYGIELGNLGTFTLRVVYPWFKDGELLGYLELGEEIEHLTPRIKKITDIDLVYTIDKAFLEEGALQSGRDGVLIPRADWDEYDQFVIIGKTLSSLSPALEKFIVRNHFQINSESIAVDDRFLNLCSHPLLDVSGRQVGSTVLIADISEITSGTRKTLVFLAGAILTVCFSFFIFYYICSGRIEKQVFTYRHQLKVLVRERTRELQMALDEVKILSGYLPICASCKQIRDDKGYWTQIESYIREHSEAEFSHGICPDCAKKLYPGLNSNSKKED